MLFERPDGVRIDFHVLGYQFPDGDCDWLNVRCRVSAPGVVDWEKTDPSIEVADLLAISRWVDRRAVSTRFLEPNLRFERVLIGAEEFARVSLSAECKPPWIEGRTATLDFPASAVNWSLFSQEVDQWQQRFPSRMRSK